MERIEKRGTCPACFGEFQLFLSGGKTVVGRHGWQEQGGRQAGVYGRAWHAGECFGVGYLPFELSPEGTFAFLQQVLYPICLGYLSTISTLENGTPTLTIEVTEYGKKRTATLTPTSKDGRQYRTAYRHLADGSVESFDTTWYEYERLRRIRENRMGYEAAFSDGQRLLGLAQAWKLADLLDGSPKAPTVHYKVARLPYCGSRSFGLLTTDDAAKTTCTRCLKALEAEAKRMAEHEAKEADAAALTEYLRTSGPQTKAQIKKGLGWDMKRTNRAIDQAERPWRDGKTQPGTIRTVYQYPKPEAFAAV